MARTSRTRSQMSLWVSLLLMGSMALSACSEEKPRQFGEAFNVSSAIPLSKLWSNKNTDRSEAVVVTGLIGEVCQSAGCWFVLRETVEGQGYEILIDLKPRASFTIPASLQGRKATVAGVLAGEGPDLQLKAIGLMVE